MLLISDEKTLSREIDSLRKSGKLINFIPTMGNLHLGHSSLFKKSENTKEIRVVSIFVNPLQFNDDKDFDNYPRTIESDKKKLLAEGVDVLFLPDAQIINVVKFAFKLGHIARKLCGVDRGGHFEGVAKIILKFLDIIKPDSITLGEKDYQQLLVIKKIIKELKFKSNQTIISFISTITLPELKKMIKVRSDIVRAIPLPPISLKKGPVPICPPNKKVRNFFNKIGSTIEIKNEKLSINFWSTSGMMASYYEILRTMSEWLVKKGIKRTDAQKYISSLFLALSEDAVLNSKKDFRILVSDSQTPGGLNQQGLKEIKRKKVNRILIETLNSIHKRLNK